MNNHHLQNQSISKYYFTKDIFQTLLICKEAKFLTTLDFINICNLLHINQYSRTLKTLQLMMFSTPKKAILLFAFLFTQTFLLAQIPKLISYQGILTDNQGQVLADGNYTVTVKIFDAATGGSELWSENHSVNLVSGLFNIALGSNTDLNLAFNQPYFISTTINGTELLPRSAMTASPYALNAPNNGQGQGGQAKTYALDAEDGSKVDVVLVDSEGQVGIGDNPGVMPEAFTFIFADEPARIGLQTDIIYNPSTRMATGIYAQSSFSTLFEEDNDLAKGIHVNMLGENASIHTGVLGLADSSPEGYGLWGRALNNDRNTGIYGEAFGGDETTGVLGVAGSGTINYAIRGLNNDAGWAGFFQGKGYFGSISSNAPTDNRSAQLFVDGTFSNFGILATANDVGAKFEGGNQALIAESTSETGFSGLFNGPVFMQDGLSSTAGSEHVTISTALKNTALTLRNTTSPANNEESVGLLSVVSNPNGVGGRFIASKLGSRFFGDTGIEVFSTNENSYSGIFYGDVKVLRQDQDPDQGEDVGTIIRSDKVNLIRRDPVFLETDIEPGNLEIIEDVDNDVRVRINPPFISIRGNTSVSQRPRLIFYDEGIDYTILGTTEGLSFLGGRTLFDNSNGLSINRETVPGSAELLSSYGLNIDGGTHGIAIKLKGLTNSNNNFMSFMDDSEFFPFQGSIVGNSDVSDIAEVLESFIKSILKPDPSVSSTQRLRIPDPFDQEQKSPNGDSNNGFAKASGANSATFSTVLQTLENAEGDKVRNVEFLINQLMMFIDVLDASFTVVAKETPVAHMSSGSAI
ncbi:MAG: hypothetical protein AAFO07_30040, partial [Bacteroidota bacterium]